MKPAIAVVLFLLIFSGCATPPENTNGTQPEDDPCRDGYYVGCDDNPDAHYMLETLGLHQFTNKSFHISEPQVEAGLVAWSQGGFGDPHSYQAYSISNNWRAEYRSPSDFIPLRHFVGGVRVFLGQTPILGEQEYGNKVGRVWTPTNNDFAPVPTESEGNFFPEGFDGRWALMEDDRRDEGYQNSLWGVEVDTGKSVLLFEGGGPRSGYYGTPLVAQAISNGSAFISLMTENPGEEIYSRIFEINLETGGRTLVLNHTNALTFMDASPEYLVVPVGVHGVNGTQEQVWAMDRQTREWTNVERRQGADIINPKVGGGWVVYLEKMLDSGALSLVAVHVPTKQSFTLIDAYQDFGYVAVDTDGFYVVLHLQAHTARQSSLQFEGTQLYWMDLPEVQDAV